MKKIIAMVLALVMVLGCLAACNQTPPAETKDTTPPAKETTEYVAPTQNTEKKEELGKLPLAEGNPVITIGVQQSTNTEDYETNEYTKWIEEQTGIDLQFVYFASSGSDAKTQLNLMIAGNEELPDILWGFTGVNSDMRNELGEDGYFIDLKDYFSEYGYWFWEAYNEVNEGDQVKIFQYGTNPSNGGFYAFPQYSESKSDNCLTCPAINTTWLEAIGEEIPTTVEELYNVLKKFATEDPNGNGTSDEIPMLSFAGYKSDLIAFVINAYVYYVSGNHFNATDGQLWTPFTTDEYRQAMIYLNQLYSEGLLSPLSYTVTTTGEIKSLLTPENGPALVGFAGMSPSLHQTTNSPIALEYKVVAPLKGATELGGYAATSGNSFIYNTFITEDCEDPVLAFKLLDFMTSKESFLRMRYGVLDEDWVWGEEGAVSASGTVAAVKVIDSSAYSAQNNRTWHAVNATIMPLHMWAGTWVNDGSWSAVRTKNLTMDKILAFEEASRPAEVVQKLIYTSIESEVVSDLKSPINDYVNEAQAMFISGVMDPNDDAQWNTYLANLDSLDLDSYLQLSQQAYDRMLSE